MTTSKRTSHGTTVEKLRLSLASKARELMIEKALEKVREVALKMKEPADMLKICKAISQQLAKLGVKEIRNVQTAIFYPQRGTYMNYEFYAKHNRTFITDVEYKNHKIQVAFARKMMKGANEKVVEHLKGDKLRDWYNYQKSTNQFADKYILTAHSLNYYWYSLGPVALGISTYAPLNKDELELFQRFMKVFELAYRRYLDIEKAAAQAREAQIEAALERIRAASLAMRDSSALGDIIYKLYGELTKLDAKLDRCFIMIVNPENKGITWWLAGKEGLLAENGFLIPMNQHPSHLMYLDHWKKRKKKWQYLFAGKEKRDWDRFGFTKTELARLPEFVKKDMASVRQIHLSGSSDQFGSLVTGSIEPLPDEQQEILSRFSIAFNQAYTRFLDLQKAEAQAREAQIEAALERVRARTMAMQNSDELPQAANLLFQQVQSLGMPAWSAGYCIWDDDKKGITLWMSSEGVMQPSFHAPLTKDPSFIHMREAYEKGQTFHVEEVGGKALVAHYKYMRSLPVVGQVLDSIIEAGHPLPTFQIFHCVYFSQGFLLFITYETVPDAHEIFKRFGKVFDQTYTRFLDLQKAEAQAREALIEASLEKVRARSLAMQKPGELTEVATLLRSEMGALGVEELETSSIYIMAEKDTAECWYAIKDVRGKHTKLVSDEMTLQLNDTWVGKEMQKFYQSEKEQTSIVMKGQHRKDWINYCAKKSKVLKGYYGAEIPERTYHLVKFPGGYMGAASPASISNESWDLMKRAAVVFSLAYTRFKDLQDAEARAKEAQVELALERVRARSLAMHHTSELQEVVNEVAQQLLSIGIDINGGVFIVINDEVGEDIPLWASAGMTDYVQKVVAPFLNRPFFTRLRAAFKKRNHLYIEQCTHKEKAQLFEHLFQYEPWKSTPAKRKRELLSRTGGLSRSIAVSHYTSIAMTDHYGRKFSDAENEILTRFGKVFEQSYIRFLDLQKAEAQAREAQIEAALERIRARALAMHQSEEFTEVAKVMREQMGQLGQQELETSAVHLYNEDADNILSWRAFRLSSKSTGNITYGFFKIPKASCAIAREFVQKFKSKATDYTIEVSGAKQTEWYKILFNLAPEVGEAMKKSGTTKEKRYYHFSKFSGGALLMVSSREPAGDVVELQKRSAQVFDLAYRRFKDLQKAEAQAREAEIELGLERVRAKAMSMHHSNELADLVAVVFRELTGLGFPLTSSMLWIHDHARAINTIWIASAEMNTPPQSYTITPFYNDFFKSIIHAWKARDPRWTFALTGQKKKDFEQAFFKELPSLPAPFRRALTQPKQVVFSASFNNFGALEIAATEPLTSEKFEILHRFGKVFDLSYTRFNDLEKAEAQAREAEIQLALERVRARTMAMQKSEELPETSLVLYEQLKQLGEPAEQLTIGVVHEENNAIEISATVHGGVLNKIHWHSIDEPYMMNKVYQAWKAQQKTLIVELKGDQLNAYNKYRNQLTNSEMFPTDYDDEHRRIVYAAFFSKGMLALAANEPRPPQTLALLDRFASVFDLTYTRFLDLQNAEEQAREAQIEAALERVRSRSMGMQKSDELKEVIQIVYDQLVQLKLPVEHTGFILDYKNQADFNSWIADHLGSPSNITIPYFDAIYYNRFNEAKQKGLASFAVHLSRKEKNKFYRDLFKHLPGFPETSKEFILKQPALTISTVLLDHVALYMENFSETPYSDEENEVLMRFGNAFQQAYTRFLDLQKAEAQAREAQIEAALERVRSRTIGMQHSNELKDAANLLFQQILDLGVPVFGCGFNIWDEDRKYTTAWMSGQDRLQEPFKVSTSEDIFIRIYNANERGESLFVEEQAGEALKTHYAYLNSIPVFKAIADKMAAVGQTFPTFQIMHCAFFSQGYLMFITFEPVPSANDIFKRFTKVFEQTYTRFLDLQKAEAQAREAQIEGALERVRSRSMAMHKSEELSELSLELVKQVQALGVATWFCAFNIYDDDPDSSLEWGSNGQGVFSKYRTPREGVFLRYYEAGQRGETLLINEIGEDQCPAHYEYLCSLPGVGDQLLKMKEAGIPFPASQIDHVAFFKHGYIIFITYKPVPDTHDIFKRFARVFEQSYTRFLDLKNAEAQAREAQIEAALERVRSRTMGMQRSKELNEVAFVLFEQIRLLGGQLWGSGFALCNEQPGCDEFWFANEMGVMPPVSIPNTEDDVHKAMLQGWKEKQEYLLSEKGGDALAAHYEYLYSLPQLKAFFDPMLAAGFNFPTWQQWHAAYFSKGYLLIITTGPYAESDIFRRFAKVFDQTYTRFLDLQKAEAQAREAQIEAALERIRSKSLAMHHSSELSAVVDTLLQEFTKLEFSLTFCIINLINEEDRSNTVWAANPETGKGAESYYMKFEDYDFHRAMWNAWKAQDKRFVYTIEGEEKRIYDEYLYSDTEFRRFPKHVQEANKALPRYVAGFTFFKYSGLQTVSVNEITEHELEILERFGRVFEQAYTRFLDLQKAEAQAREAQIEAALERIRSKTMAMQNSDDVVETMAVMFGELEKLGIENLRGGIALFHPDESMEVWSVTHLPDGKMSKGIGSFDMHSHPLWQRLLKTWKGKKELALDFLGGSEKKAYIQILNSSTYLSNPIKDLPDSHFQCYFFKEGGVWSYSLKPHSENDQNIMKRIAAVFALTFRRYQDLKTAEAQAREAKIQLALERARAQSMMMQHSKELDETLRVFHEQVLQLGIPSAFSFLWLPDEENDRHIFWAVWAENNSTVFKSKAINYPLDRNEPATAQCLIDWKSKEIVSYQVPATGVESYFGAWSELIDGVEHLKPEHFREGLYYVEAFIKYGCFGVLVKNDLTEDEKRILYRFAIEFERTYTRFLDLQKAEAQTREGQIQLALERVRARTMAMHRSVELAETAQVLFGQLIELGGIPDRISIGIVDEKNGAVNFWATDQSGTQIQKSFSARLNESTVIAKSYKAWKEKKNSLLIELTGDDLDEWIRFAREEMGIVVKEENIHNRRVHAMAFFSDGWILVTSNETQSAEGVGILERFAAVFNLTYRRFLDLQKAEAQAREAQIEASLERVRSRSIAMRKSEEIADIAGKIFSELRQLDLALNRVLIWTFNDIEQYTIWWSSNPEVESTANSYRIDYNDNPVFLNYLKAWQQREPIHLYTLSGDTKKNWEDFLFEHTEMSRLPAAVKNGMRQERTLFTISIISDYGIMMSGSHQPLSDDNIDIIQRFGRVFQQSYTRYLDVQKAEAQAKEAQIEAALEKVRSRTLAMQKSEELAETAAVLFRQLIGLGIEPNRLYITIIKDDTADAEFWITDEDGSKISYAYTANLNDNSTFRRMYQAWRQNEKSLIIDLQGKDLDEYLRYLISINVPFRQGLTQKRRVSHIAFFSNGFIGMASPDEQPAATLQLMERFAAVFNLTFTRFNDLKMAEAHALQAEQDLIAIKEAKQKAEEALTELQATQKQLIQSEKMASLGELTAGIAHEIQNPLNFVNNFSDVSVDLIKEMKEEIENGNTDDAKAIAEDLIGNLQKIHLHGERAAAIVKGMLQHSRSSSGVKEPTDINALCDEYLRLAYHGLRAKDKSFNAKFETSFDSSIGKVDVMPQEMGRVILNLINNAFYAVNERKRNEPERYEPLVTVATRKSGEQIEISIADNGTGIPEKAKEKIFQPFFTTKPTGQGTGLGLSLSYDIVTKGHGGEFSVKTTEGEGTEFIVQLPIQ